MAQAISIGLATKLKEFGDFHKDLKSALDHRQIPLTQEQSFWEEQVQQYKVNYYQQLELLGEDCKDFSLEQRKSIFHQFSKGGIAHMLKDAPYFYHSIFKPRGYAGDAEMMALIYRNQYEGKTLFGKVMHKIGTECAAGIAIRNRKQLMAKEFEALGKGKVLSLAAGPAQEIYDVLEKGYDQLEFTALDHDIITLKNAQNGSYPNKEFFIEFVEGQIMGRFKNGTPIALSPTSIIKDKAVEEAFNNFNVTINNIEGLEYTDTDGSKCPFAAHIRKANPRTKKEYLNKYIPKLFL